MERRDLQLGQIESLPEHVDAYYDSRFSGNYLPTNRLAPSRRLDLRMKLHRIELRVPLVELEHLLCPRDAFYSGHQDVAFVRVCPQPFNCLRSDGFIRPFEIKLDNG